MIAKKVCMIGAFSVGKSALVERFVNSMFSDRYLSTVGVKISKKVVKLDGDELTVVLWDMEGKDDFADVNMSYLRGAMGFFVVADGTRKETLSMALHLRKLALETAGEVPYVLLVNKADLHWDIPEDQLAALEASGIPVIRTSAKTGQAVEEAFLSLARAMMKG
ncbi:MAG: GTP-binding protein [Candidatus Accumulibacter sp.]|jgi:small GTP-binding protein|nr:GTP-binding protein [Accumulibacter sp.]